MPSARATIASAANPGRRRTPRIARRRSCENEPMRHGRRGGGLVSTVLCPRVPQPRPPVRRCVGKGMHTGRAALAILTALAGCTASNPAYRGGDGHDGPSPVADAAVDHGLAPPDVAVASPDLAVVSPDVAVAPPDG